MPSLAAIEIVGDVRPVESCPEEKNTLDTTRAINVTTDPGLEAAQAQSTVDSATTRGTRKRRNTVTPSTPTNSSKKKQQSKAGQRTLASFFFPASSDKSSSKSNTKKARTGKAEAAGPHQIASQPFEESASSPSPCSHAESQAAAEPSKNGFKERTSTSTAKKDSEICADGPLDSKNASYEKAEIDNGHRDEIKVQENCSQRNHQEQDPAMMQHQGPRTVLVSKSPQSMKAILESRNDGSRDKCVIDVDAESKVNGSSTKGSSPSPETSISQKLFQVEGSKNDNITEVTVDAAKVELQKGATQSLPDLPAERLTLVQKHKHMEERYTKRAEALVLGARGGLDEEIFDMPEPQQAVVEAPTDDEFPACVVANIALHIEGSPLSLSKLATKLRKQLEESHSVSWKLESITTKIKLLAKRKSYLETSGVTVDLFEDETEDRMWRWEVISMELLPESVTAKVKKARAARKKLLSHYTATVKLVSSLQDADKLVSDKSLPNLDAVLAKISRSEEKVLKFEREAEKQREIEKAKERKLQETISKKEEKELAAEKKRKEKERKKEEAARAREEAKRQKEEEKEGQKKLELEKLDQKQATLKKQRDCMKSFFVTAPKQVQQKSDEAALAEDRTADAPSIEDDVNSRDGFNFRSVINSEVGTPSDRPFAIVSNQAKESRKRRVRQVPVSVYMTVVPDNAFDAQPFAERTIIQVRNKYRFLSFHEDCRPSYYGTWSKTSSVITGRNPFGKDEADLDYDVDSEGEWEEGDDEIGEDVDDDEKNKDDEVEDEEGDCREYNYEDGFCVADQDYLAIDEDVDEETQILYKKKFQSNGNEPQQNGCVPNRICIIAPSFGGVPMSKQVGGGYPETIEGFGVQEARDLLESHEGITLLDADLCLDAFPPPLVVDEVENTLEISASTQKDEYSTEDMKTLARFVHHCTLNSKEKVIEELRNQYATAFSSRAKATRKLDSIAIKRRREVGNGVFWEVKKEILDELGLQELHAKILEPVVDAETTSSEPVAVESKHEATSSKAPSSNGKKRARRKAQTDDGSAKKKKRKDSEVETGGTKKKSQGALAASANLMKEFLKKAKVNDPQPKRGEGNGEPTASSSTIE